MYLEVKSIVCDLTPPCSLIDSYLVLYCKAVSDRGCIPEHFCIRNVHGKAVSVACYGGPQGPTFSRQLKGGS
jgi:hypothetical protein